MINGRWIAVVMPNLGNWLRNGLIWVLLCFGIGSLWGTSNAPEGLHGLISGPFTPEHAA